MIGNRGIVDQAAAVIEDPGGVADLNGNGKGTGKESVKIYVERSLKPIPQTASI